MAKDVSVRLMAITTQYKAAMADAGRATSAMATQATNASVKAKRGLTQMSGAAGLGSLALGAVAVNAGKMALDFDSSFAKIEGLVGVAAEELDGMKDAVLGLAGETAKSPQELADALFYITSAGLEGETALEALEMAAKASAAGLGDTATVADAVTSAMNAYGPEVLSAAEATDILVAAVREGKLEPDALAGAMGKVIPIASQMGIEFEEVAGALAVMSRTGTSAEEGTTAIRAILTGLLDPAAEVVDVLADVGLSVDDVKRSLDERGLVPTLRDLQSTLADNDQGLEAIFPNVRALAGALDILGGDAETVDGIMQGVADSAGDANKAFEVMADTAQFQLTAAFQAWKADVVSEVGDVVEYVMWAKGQIDQVPTGGDGGLAGMVTGEFERMFNPKKQLEGMAGVIENEIIGPFRSAEQATLEATGALDSYYAVKQSISDAVLERDALNAEAAAAALDEERRARLDALAANRDHYRGLKDLNAQYDDLDGNIDDVVQSIRNFTEEFNELKGEIEDRSAWDSLQDGFDGYISALETAGDTSEKTTREQEADARRVQAAVDSLKLDVIRYGYELGNLPNTVTSEIVAMLDNGAVMEAEAILERIARQREALIVVRTQNAGVVNLGSSLPSLVNTNSQTTRVLGAEGAIVNGPTSALIGEAGPEAVIPLHKIPGNESVDRLASAMGMGGGGTRNFYLTVNGSNMTPKDVVNHIRRFERANGPRWRN